MQDGSGLDLGVRAIGDLYNVFKSCGLQPPLGEVANSVWRPRECNSLADALANVDEGSMSETFDSGSKHGQ